MLSLDGMMVHKIALNKIIILSTGPFRLKVSLPLLPKPSSTTNVSSALQVLTLPSTNPN